MNWIVKLREQQALRPWQQAIAFVLAYAVSITRRPDAILHAQFLQEDGHTWFADAYNFGGWAGACRIYEGYHHLFPRLGAALALLLPLTLAPLALNCIAIAIQILPINILLSSRSSAWGNLEFRAMLAGILLVLPNTLEMLNNISQAQWPLTLCALLVLVASQPKRPAERIFDLCILLLCGLTGPQCVFLFCIALFLAWKRKSRWLLAAATTLAATCFVQGWGLLNGGFSSRPHHALGATPVLLGRILGGQIFLATLLGGNGLAMKPQPWLAALLVAVAIGGIVIAGFCYNQSPSPMRLFVLLTLALLAVSLLSPTAYPSAGVTMWQLLAGASGIRYWYFPSLAFAWLLLWGFQSGIPALKAASATLLCVMCFGLIRDWRIPPVPDLHWTEEAKSFEAAPAGTIYVFPENPPGWNMTLIKRASKH